MKKLLSLCLITGSLLSCTKKSTPTPAVATNVIQYSFSADNSGMYVMNYYDGVSSGTAESITASSWSKSITIPSGTTTANIFFTAGQNPPYTNNTGTVTIKLNGKTVATGSKQFTSTSTLAQANYTYINN